MNIIKILQYIIPNGLFLLAKKYLTKNIFNNFRKNFKYFSVRENSVLLIEFYSVHGESLPGHIKYFLDLGYCVDVIVSKQKKKYYLDRNDKGLFDCFNNALRINILSNFNMNFLLRSSIVYNYKHIMINTFADGMENRHLYGVNLFQLKPICVMHNQNMNNEYFKTNKIISHVKINSINLKSPIIVNPHYYCEIIKREKSKITTFVAINAKNLNRRNLYLLFNACDFLFEKGITNFSIKILGNGIIIPKQYKDNLIDFGYIDYQKMYKEISNSDFILGLIDQASVQYTNKASGTYQLSYGFLKPIILHKMFSNVAGFNKNNSILYDDNDNLADSMEKCINMSNEDYLSIVDNLEQAEKELYISSLNNFKITLESPLINNI